MALMAEVFRDSPQYLQENNSNSSIVPLVDAI
jgi:hypothetical protein